jgi:hypothetical protein
MLVCGNAQHPDGAKHISIAILDLEEDFTKEEQVGRVHINPFENEFQNI